MNSIQFCDDCDNIMYKHINDDNKLFNVCKVCLNMKEINLDNYIYENKKEIDSSEIINKNQFILNDNTLSTTTNPKNIKCPNKDCETNTDKIEFSFISIKYDISNMKFIYKCKTCNQCWLNN